MSTTDHNDTGLIEKTALVRVGGTPKKQVVGVSIAFEIRNAGEVTSELRESLQAIVTDKEIRARVTEILQGGSFDVSIAVSTMLIGTTTSEDAGAPADLTPDPQLRGESRLMGWTSDGTLVQGSQVESAWGLLRQSIDAARNRGEIFSIKVRGKHWYPAQFKDFSRQDFAEINRSLGDTDPSSKLLCPHAWARCTWRTHPG